MIKKILYAEDERDVLDVVRKRLSTGGFEVFPAENGKDAYDLTVKHNPDLIITDVMMPVMNGFEFCKALKHNEQTKQIPIIVLTAKANMEDSFIFLGVNDFLRKPFQFEQLEVKIKDRLSLTAAMHTSKTKILFHCVKPAAMTAARTLIESVPQWSSKFVNTGAEVLARAQEFVPEVIVLDLFMSDMPVYEVTAQLKMNPELANAQILTYYSPLSSDQDQVAIQAKMLEVQYLKNATTDAGAKEYLGPFNPANFVGLFNDYRKDIAV